jgi:hypothetical protein
MVQELTAFSATHEGLGEKDEIPLLAFRATGDSPRSSWLFSLKPSGGTKPLEAH